MRILAPRKNRMEDNKGMKITTTHGIDTLAEKIFATYKEREEPNRAHLGASVIGRPCDREIWLSFRWALAKSFDGRMLKLFKRGHFEEYIMIGDLEKVGIAFEKGTTGDEQKHLVFLPHFEGSPDGIIESGVPGAQKKKHLFECKTMSKKNFDKLEKDREIKKEHVAQMNIYMRALGLDAALYCAVCKDDDRLFFERVKYDEKIATYSMERARRIIQSARMPEPINGASPEWFQCKMCSAYDFCHITKKITCREVNCRTCAHSTPAETGKWTCALYSLDDIPLDDQRTGCADHVIHPDLVPWIMREEESTIEAAAYVIDGEIVLNGHGGKDSRFLLSDEFTQKLCDTFKGTVQP